MNKILKYELFEQRLRALFNIENLNYRFLYNVYNECVMSSNNIKLSDNVATSDLLNHNTLIMYIVNEHIYAVETSANAENVASLEHSDAYFNKLSSLSLDKYISNEHLKVQNTIHANKYSPLISSPSVYINFMQSALINFHQNTPQRTLVVDVLNKGLNISQCVISLLVNGYATEAFSTWRTLHETECILRVLFYGGKEVLSKYLKHMEYSMAFRKQFDKVKTDSIFEEIKENMRSHNLKSKDMKKYIEYGWMFALPNFVEPEYKLNFRDGLEKLANLSSYSKTYEMSSEIAHGSPLLIYSRKNYFQLITLINLYESLIRLDDIFHKIYIKSVDKELCERFIEMREIYYPILAANLVNLKLNYKKQQKN